MTPEEVRLLVTAIYLGIVLILTIKLSSSIIRTDKSFREWLKWNERFQERKWLEAKELRAKRNGSVTVGDGVFRDPGATVPKGNQ